MITARATIVIGSYHYAAASIGFLAAATVILGSI
jgi:hypothetical protein